MFPTTDSDPLAAIRSQLHAGIRVSPLCRAVIGWLCSLPTDPAVQEIHLLNGQVWLRLSTETTLEPVCAFLEFLEQIRIICTTLRLDEAQTAAVVAHARRKLA